MENIEFYTVEEVAKVLRVTPKTLKKWAKAGKMPAHLSPSGKFIFTRGDIHEGAIRKIHMSLSKPPGG